MKARKNKEATVSKTKTRSDRLEKGEERFISAFENMLEGVQMLGHDWRYLYLNHSSEVHNRRPNRDLLGNRYMDMWPGIEDTHVFSVIKHCLEDRVSAQLENRFVYPDGELGWFHLSIQPIPEGVLILSFDITERVRAEKQSIQMKRLYAALSQVNQTIVRVENQNELFESICKVAVELGEFCLAWIGLIDHQSGELTPVAVQARGQNELPFQRINTKEAPYKEGLIGLALQSGTAQFSNDVQVDPRMAHWRETAVKGNYHSAAAIPFRKHGEIFGLLNLYAVDIDFFQAEEEQSLLEEMGMDISFALDTMESERTKRQWADAFEHCAHGIAIGLPSGRLLTCNPAFARAHGSTIQEISYMPILSMYDLQDHEQIKQFITQADRQGTVNFEANKVRKDGSVYPVEMDLISVRDENGNLLYRVATQQDITERKQMEEALRWSEVKFSILFNEAPYAAQLANLPDGLIVEVNEAFENLMGYSREEALGKSSVELNVYPDPETRARMIAEFKVNGFARNVETTLRTKSGDLRTVLVNSDLVEITGEKYVLTTAQDVTERKQAEAALKVEMERFQRFVESNIVGIVIANASGTILTANDYYLNILGVTRKDFEDGTVDWRKFTTPEWLAADEKALRELQEHGICEPYEKEYARVDGTRVPVYIADTMLPGPEEQIAAFVLDTTDLKQAEAALRESWTRIDAIITSAMDAIISIDADQHILLLNAAAEQIFQCRAAEVIGESLERFIPERFRAAHRRHIEQFGRDGTTNRTMGHLSALSGLRANGEEFPIEASISQAEIAGKKVFTVILRDITERKQAEANLISSEMRYRRLFESAKDGILILDAETGMIMDANPFLITLLGYSKEDFLSKHIWELGFFKDILASKANFLELQQMEYIRYEDLPLETASGQRIHVEFVSNVYKVDHQKVIQCNIRDITERKHAEEALAESEAKYRTLVESAEDTILLTDLTGKHLFANSAYYTSLGYGVGEDPDQDGFGIVHPDDLPMIQARMPELFERGALATEYRVRHRSGRWLYRSSKSVLIKGNHGEPKSILAIIRDITERKKAEAKIRQQFEHLNSLRAIDTAITSSFDLPVTLDVVLQQVLSQLGVNAAAILLVNPEMQTIEYAASRGFHSDILHHTRLKLKEGYAGRAVRERKTIHISDLMETGGSLASSLILEHESFVDYYSTPLNVKGEVKGVLEIYHRSNLTADADWLEYLETLAGQAAIAIDNAQLFENLQRSNTELERRVLERTAALNKANAELEHANRAKDEFLANMSHELRTPLNSILGMSESLLEQRRGSLNEHQQKSLQIVETSGKHLLELINDILDLSKAEAGKVDIYPEPVSVDELCRASLAFVKAQAMKKSIRVTYTNQSAVTEISADIRRLKQILVNLLTNAVKFTPENGNITLQVNTELEQDLIRFSVIDTGIGISPEDLQRLFQPFVQVDSSLNRQHEGTGLGLTLVQKLTDLHGGSVQVESEVGRGSRFTIDLPCRLNFPAKSTKSETDLDKASPNPVNRTTDTSDVQAERGVILLAEDNMANILTIGEYVESYGYRVVVAHDGLEALAKAEEVGPDLILMDIQMPAMNGLEAMARLRANSRFAATPIIALTALAMPGDRERCLEAGANEYMSKPVSLKALIKKVKQLLGSEE